MSRNRLSRREWLKQASLLGAAAPLVFPSYPAFGQSLVQEPDRLLPRDPTPGLPARLFSFDPSLYRFTADEDVFLDEVEQALEAQLEYHLDRHLKSIEFIRTIR